MRTGSWEEKRMARGTLKEPTSAAVDQSGDDALDVLDEIYAFRESIDSPGREDVRAYLGRYPELVPVVIEASARIPEFLPSANRPVLELVPYQEDKEEEGTLFVVIQTEREWEEVGPLLARLRREWLIDASRRVDGRLNVGVDYV